ncbi:MAG: DNA cytosine methyltransferase [Planctomycetota bacterium]|nr:MAG: DNA cytosine methyltransferase [Planctomycetota bacterium]
MTHRTRTIKPQRAQAANFTFIDLFAGCGGLSLGLLVSGWEGLFAIEKSPDAFKTLRHNLVDEGSHNRGKPRIDWPDWLGKEHQEIRNFINTHRRRLRGLRGMINLVAGGPPCQGFSFAGRRSGSDPRNNLFKFHLEIVDLTRPELVLLENVQGIDTAFGIKEARKTKRRGRPRKSYASRIRDALREHGYRVQQELVKAADFGVPQLRPRYFTVGIRQDLFSSSAVPDFFEILRGIRIDFLKTRRLPVRRPVNVAEAISDLETVGKEIVMCCDPESPPGFKEIVYERPKSLYQKLMHGNVNGRIPNSLRLVNHRPETISRFKKIFRTCRKGVQLSDNDRERLGIKKTAIVPLSPDLPSHTLTTLPDDLLHYAEPRIHTVREYARLQSFPDWFEFRGKYTTGGDRRVKECPRYTQVGNAVPPLLAEVIGEALRELLYMAHYVSNTGRVCLDTRRRGKK